MPDMNTEGRKPFSYKDLDSFKMGKAFHEHLPRSWYLMGSSLALYCTYTQMNPDELFSDRRATFRLEDLDQSRKHENLYNGFLKWLAAKKGLNGKPYSSNSVQTRATAVKVFYSRIVHAKLDAPDGIKVSTVRETDIPSTAQVGQIVNLLNDPVSKAASMGALQSGMGVSDLLTLQWTDGSEFGTVTQQLKSDHPIHIRDVRKKTTIKFQTCFGTATKKLLLVDDYPREDPRVFPITVDALEEQVKAAAAKIKKADGTPLYVTPHKFRARFSSVLKLAKVDHDFVEYMMAHKLPTTTAAYLGASGDELIELYKTFEARLTPEGFG